VQGGPRHRRLGGCVETRPPCCGEQTVGVCASDIAGAQGVVSSADRAASGITAHPTHQNWGRVLAVASLDHDGQRARPSRTTRRPLKSKP